MEINQKKKPKIVEQCNLNLSRMREVRIKRRKDKTRNNLEKPISRIYDFNLILLRKIKLQIEIYESHNKIKLVLNGFGRIERLLSGLL